MNIIYTDYNIYHNSFDICTYAGYILRKSSVKVCKPYVIIKLLELLEEENKTE